MANWEKKIKSGGGKDLQPGENLVGGVMLNPKGTTTQAVARGVGGLVGGAIATKMSERQSGGTSDDTSAEVVDSDTGLAAQLPDGRIWLGLTSGRLLVWGHSAMSGKPKGLKMTMSSADLVQVDLEKLKATFTTTLRFSDGSAKVYEAPKLMNDPEAFAAAVANR